jgi:hypothetical protein
MKLSHVTAAIAVMVVMTLTPHHASAAVDTYLQLNGIKGAHVSAFGFSQIISIISAVL